MDASSNETYTQNELYQQAQLRNQRRIIKLFFQSEKDLQPHCSGAEGFFISVAVLKIACSIPSDTALPSSESLAICTYKLSE